MNNPLTKGMFVNLNLNYQILSSEQQAEKILNIAAEFVADKAKGVAITYSANYGQTRKIQRVYFAGGWNTETNGANQAAVMHKMESLLAGSYKHLQNKMRIAPITTMNAYDTPVVPWNEDVLMGIAITDLDRIQTYLEEGWYILGWQNHRTANDQVHPYAVGGGIATLPDALASKIQQTLMSYAHKYKNIAKT